MALTVVYGNELFESVLQSFMSDKPVEHRELASELMTEVKASSIQERSLIFCMSARPNLLNQWRDYGRDIVPYCIEFDAPGLLKPDWNFSATFVPLIYKSEDQLRLCHQLISELYETTSRLAARLEDADRQTVLSILSVQVRLLTLHFKHPAFEAEEEWRMLAFPEWLKGQSVQFRTSPLGVVPFLARKPREGTLLPITKIWVGPSPHGTVSADALQTLLRSRGYNIPVEASQIPSR